MPSAYRLTIFLGIVLVGLGAYVYFVEIPTTHQATEIKTRQQQLLPFDDREITQVTMTTRTETIVIARDQRRRWQIIDPIQTRADSREVGKILRALTLGKVERIIQEVNSNSEKFGLSPPLLTLTLVASDRTERLFLGDPGPISSTLYARKESDGNIVLTTLDPQVFFNKSLYTFRQKDILHFDRMQADQLRLQYEGKELVLYRIPSIHGLTQNWRFRSPIDAPADRTKVGILLMTLEDLTAVGFIDAEVDKKELLRSFGKPKASVTVHAGKRDHALSLFQPGGLQTAFAMTSLEQPLYRIDPQTIRDVTKSLFYLRDKRLLGMETNEIAILSVKTRNESYVLIKQNEEWLIEEDPSMPLNQELIRLFVSRVVDLPAELRIAEEKISLESHGFKDPSAEFTAVDRRGLERGRLSLGKVERGLVYAMGAGLPGIYQARSNILTQIPTKDELFAK